MVPSFTHSSFSITTMQAAASTLRLASRRTYSTAIASPHPDLNMATAAIAAAQPVIRPPRPVGAFRGGILGFMIGAAAAGGAGYYYLLDEYHTAAGILQSTVQDLQESSFKVQDYAKKIEAVEAQLKALKTRTATEEDARELMAEIKRVFDGLKVEHLELKSHVWGLEMDLQKVQGASKKV